MAVSLLRPVADMAKSCFELKTVLWANSRPWQKETFALGSPWVCFLEAGDGWWGSVSAKSSLRR
jgi:hypothetical protein